MREPVYVASRASLPERPAMWRFLRDELGFPICSSWIDEAGVGQTASMAVLWKRIQAEVTLSVGVVLYAEVTDLPLKGAYVECGMALAQDKHVAVIVPGTTAEERRRLLGSWVAHPNVQAFDTPEEGLRWLLG